MRTPRTTTEPSVKQVLCHFLGGVRGLTQTTTNVCPLLGSFLGRLGSKRLGFLDGDPVRRHQNRPLLALTGRRLRFGSIGSLVSFCFGGGSAALRFDDSGLAHCAPRPTVGLLGVLVRQVLFALSGGSFGLVSEAACGRRRRL